MVEREQTAIKFLMAHQQVAEAVEPAMADLDHPAPCLLGRVAPLGIGLGATTDDLSNVAARLDNLQGTPAPISSVRAQVLAAPGAWRLALDHDGIQHLIELRDVMRIGPGHDERQRDATAVHQQVSLAPIFFPDRSGCARLLLAPAAP